MQADHKRTDIGTESSVPISVLFFTGVYAPKIVRLHELSCVFFFENEEYITSTGELLKNYVSVRDKYWSA